jgi:hypothetical protein
MAVKAAKRKLKMVATPAIQIYSSPGNTQFAVSVPSTSQCSVSFYADNTGYSLLAAVVPGGMATFYSPEGFFFYQSTSYNNAGTIQPPDNTSFTLTSAIQAFNVAATLNAFEPVPSKSLITNSNLGGNSLYYVPFDVYDNVAVSRVNFFLSIGTTISASNGTGQAGYTLSAALYTKGGGTASDILYSIWSNSAYFAFAASSNSNFTFSQPNGISNTAYVSSISTTFANTNASTWLSNSLGGFREIPMPMNLTLAPGRYWMAVAASVSTANTTFSLNASLVQHTAANLINFQPFGGSSSASNASYPQLSEGYGTYSATSGAFPATVPITGGYILGAPSGTTPYFNMSNYLTNASEG